MYPDLQQDNFSYDIRREPEIPLLMTFKLPTFTRDYFDSVLSCSHFIQYNKRLQLGRYKYWNNLHYTNAVMQNNKHFTKIKVDW